MRQKTIAWMATLELSGEMTVLTRIWDPTRWIPDPLINESSGQYGFDDKVIWALWLIWPVICWFDQSFADLTRHSLNFFTYVGHSYLVSIANLATILAIGRSCTEPSLDTMDTRHSEHGWPTPAGKQDQHQDCTRSPVKLDWVLMRHIVYFERMENVRDDFM